MIKQLHICVLLLLSANIMLSQNEENPSYLTIGYLGNFGIHPGGEIGLQLPLRSIALFSDEAVNHTLVLSPQAAT
ncbi:MAG: hypothetical protein AAF388_26695, partial [Bacteroidota bacterium]